MPFLRFKRALLSIFPALSAEGCSLTDGSRPVWVKSPPLPGLQNRSHLIEPLNREPEHLAVAVVLVVLDIRKCRDVTLLGRGRASSVFPPLIRAILRESTYAAALSRTRELCDKGLSQQAFGILPKIREVDDLLEESEPARSMIREVHTELCFWAFAGGRPMTCAKKSGEGFRERMSVLEQVLPGATELVDAAHLERGKSHVNPMPIDV